MTRIVLRPARRDEARRIAEFFRMSSDGMADYLWTRAAAPGEDPLDVGARRYARSGENFSYQNCVMAEADGRVAGMSHAYVMPEPDPDFDPSTVDPVLRGPAELEIPGSFYVSGIAVSEDARGKGVGTALLRDAGHRGREAGCACVSLICFDANTGAWNLYAREGFFAVDRRPLVPHPLIHYDVGDAVLLRKNL